MEAVKIKTRIKKERKKIVSKPRVNEDVHVDENASDALQDNLDVFLPEPLTLEVFHSAEKSDESSKTQSKVQASSDYESSKEAASGCIEVDSTDSQFHTPPDCLSSKDVISNCVKINSDYVSNSMLKEKNSYLDTWASKATEVEDSKTIPSTSTIKKLDKNLATAPSLDISELTHMLPSLAVKNNEKVDHVGNALKKKMYPNLETIQYCKDMHGILSCQTLAKTYTAEYTNKAIHEANKGHKEFLQDVSDLKKYELYDMIFQFQSARLNSSDLRSKLKVLNSKLKRTKLVLWNSVSTTVQAQGKCQDGCKVNVTHEYVIKQLNQEAYEEVRKMLQELEESELSKYAFYMYVDQQMKLKVDQFVYDFIIDTKMPVPSSVTGSSVSSPLKPVYNVHTLKKCISILFSFQRVPTTDKEFLKTTRLWLAKLVSLLLYNGTLADNLFIVNHVLRCPNGIHAWASKFIQIPVPQNKDEFDCRYLHYNLVVLYITLNPIPDREHFLKNISCMSETSQPTDNNFTLLDSDGEEEDLFEILQDWSEDDVISLLNQIPMSKLYQHILLTSTTGIVFCKLLGWIARTWFEKTLALSWFNPFSAMDELTRPTLSVLKLSKMSFNSSYS